MRKLVTVAALAAGIGGFALGGIAQAASTGDFDAHPGVTNPVNRDASAATHWRVCGQYVAEMSRGRVCDTMDYVDMGPRSNAMSDGREVTSLDAPDTARRQVCDHDAFAPSTKRGCGNSDYHG